MTDGSPGATRLPLVQIATLPQVVPSPVCLSCEVCCRFPDEESFLRPYFTADEIRRAIAAGLDPRHFPDPEGGQVRVVPNPSGEGYLCPAFDPGTSHCRIYEVRPLDCQIYPLALMWSADGNQVLLGWDTKCPFLSGGAPLTPALSPRGRGEGEGVEAYAQRITKLLEGEETLEIVARNPRLIGRFQEDVVVLRILPRLTGRALKQVSGVRGQVTGGSLPDTRHRTPDTGHPTPLRLEDRSLVERAVSGIETPLAAYAFAPHFIWRALFTYSWAVLADHLCLFAEYADGLFMPLPPLPSPQPSPRRGEGRVRGVAFSDAVTACFAFMRSRNRGSAVSRVENVPRELAVQYERLGYRVRAKDPDYLYGAGELAALAGDRYKSQRAACNRFVRTRQYRVEPYNDRHRGECLALFEQWVDQKRRQGIERVADQMLRDAGAAHREALSHHEALGLAGLVVRVEGVIRAYSFEFERSPSVSCVLLEVADREVPGLAQFIFRETCRQALVRGVLYINTLDDSGLPSLAQSKRAYHPVQLVENYVVTEA